MKRAWLASVLSILGLLFQSAALAQQPDRRGKTVQTKVPDDILASYIKPVNLDDAAWSVNTDPGRPNIVRVTLDFRKLSVLDMVYNAQCTVKFVDSRGVAQVESFDIEPLRGGKVYVSEFTSTLKFSKWTTVTVKAEKLSGTLRPEIEVYETDPYRIYKTLPDNKTLPG
jgi:hypothetical protein